LITSSDLYGTVDTGGASTTVTFEYGLTTAYGTTVPGVPGTVTGNTVTAVIDNLTGLTVNTTYHYRVNGVNSAGFQWRRHDVYNYQLSHAGTCRHYFRPNNFLWQ
jgi:hypothetical protein